MRWLCLVVIVLASRSSQADVPDVAFATVGEDLDGATVLTVEPIAREQRIEVRVESGAEVAVRIRKVHIVIGVYQGFSIGDDI